MNTKNNGSFARGTSIKPRKYLLSLKNWGILAGCLCILAAGFVVYNAFTDIPPTLLKGLHKIVQALGPLFRELIIASLPYIWPPILIYVLIAFLVQSLPQRKFWNLVAVSVFFLYFVFAVKRYSWENYQQIALLAVQLYLLILWIFPREIWNVIGLLISSILGLIILVAPDLPTAFDDFGIFGAVLAFFLGYLNALASLVQRAVNAGVATRKQQKNPFWKKPSQHRATPR